MGVEGGHITVEYQEQKSVKFGLWVQKLDLYCKAKNIKKKINNSQKRETDR